MSHEESAHERLSRCRMRLAALRVSVILGPGSLRDGVDRLWSELTELTEGAAPDPAAVDSLCQRIDKLVDAFHLL